MQNCIIHGDIFYTPEKDISVSAPDSCLVIENGKIKGCFREIPEEFRSFRLLDYSGRLVIPALYDLHVHASQYQFRGLWMDEELLSWLNEHTFPEEAKYKDIKYAQKAYSIFAEDLYRSATARACIFATIHKDSSILLCSMLDELSMPCFVGKVNMDRNSPSILVEDTDESINETLSYVNEVRERFTYVKPIITPRFIPSCSDRLSSALARIAEDENLPVQSHLSENLSEVDWVKELCPQSESYADAYRMLGFMGKQKTVMAHCVHSLGREEEILKNENIYIAHCPDSNTNLTSGIMPARYFLDNGYRIGLGSDVAGGVSLSIFRAITDAVKVSKLYCRLVDPSFRALSFNEAFYIATKLGGSFFGRTGSFEEGYEADVVVLDDSSVSSTVQDLSVAERLERYAYLESDKPVIHKIVGGKILF